MLQEQANVYGEVVKICLEEANCQEISFNELVDGYSGNFHAAPQNPNLFDKDFQPKLAYERVIQELAGFDRNHAAVQARMNE